MRGESSATRAPRRGRRTTSPSSARRASASRTGMWLVPSSLRDRPLDEPRARRVGSVANQVAQLVGHPAGDADREFLSGMCHGGRQSTL